MRFVKQLISGFIHAIQLVTGLVIYRITNKTPAFSYQSMIALFCLTRGYSSDFLSWLIGLTRRRYFFSNVSGFLGDMGNNELRHVVISQLRDKGYYIFENRLPEDMCDRLMQYATSHSCKIRPMDGDLSVESKCMNYCRGNPQAVRYDFDTQDVLDNRDVQKVLADMSFATIAQDYLGARPLIDVVSMWWHTNFSDKPDMQAAQYYHFDMDRPKWLKFFIYLTDVESTNGPHTFVSGSHKTRGIPSSLLRKGYARLTDKEISEVYSERDIIEFCAPRGTIIAEDTRGLHKGKHVEQGDRLILQVQFSNSLFGGDYPKACIGVGMCDDLENAIKKYPDLYAAYVE